MRARAAIGALLLASAAAAEPAPVPGFIPLIPAEGHEAVWLAPSQVVRVGRVEGFTVLDTAAWVQQRTVEPADSVARRLMEAGQRLVPLTDLNGRRIWLAAERIVAIRESQDRHAAGARAAIIMVGLRFNTDIAVRESVEAVMAALRPRPEAPPGAVPPEAPAGR
jgi:hypothetical protein